MRTVVVTVAVLVTLGLAALGVVASRNGSLPALPSAPLAPTASSDQGNIRMLRVLHRLRDRRSA